MNINAEINIRKTSNFPEQRLLNERELLAHVERHFYERSARRIYVAPHRYIEPDFFEAALYGMLKSFERREEYEACSRVLKLLRLLEGRTCKPTP